jgi:uncharacterized protein YjdB
MRTNFLFLTALAVISAVSCNSKSDEILAVRMNQTKVQLVKGESIQLKAEVYPVQEADIVWSSQDENYVTVDNNGLVTAVALKKDAESGETKPVSVYAQYETGAAECQVTVLPLEPDKVEIVYNGNMLKLDPGAENSVQLQVKAYPEDADLTGVTWTTDYASVAVVDAETGLVTGVAPGFATIRASYTDLIYDEIDVQVNVVNPTAVAVDPSTLSLEVGQRTRLKADLTPSNASGTLVWTSENPDVVTVDSMTGAVEAKSAGTAKVKVQVGSLSAVCTVTVK